MEVIEPRLGEVAGKENRDVNGQGKAVPVRTGRCLPEKASEEIAVYQKVNTEEYRRPFSHGFQR